MIISRTPLRISFFGGSTDYPEWFLKEGGAVLSTTIDKHCYISCQYLPPCFGTKHRVVWSYVETVDTVSDILHPAVRDCLLFLGFDDSQGLDIHYQGDLPARIGLGSSSAFAVGLINSLLALNGSQRSPLLLYHLAVELEREVMKETVGCQDQAAAAFGGFNVIRFATNGEITVDPIPPEITKNLESKLMLFCPSATRHASRIAKKIVADFPNHKDNLVKMMDTVDLGVKILKGEGPIDDFGYLLHKGWLLKNEISGGITSPSVLDAYDKAMQNGALGGKLLGVGGIGSLLFYVPEEKREPVKIALKGFHHTPFKFSREGSSIIYNSEKRDG